MTAKFATALGTVLCALLTVVSCDAFAQSGLLSGISYAEFKYDSTITEVEIYTSISSSKLLFREVKNDQDSGQSHLASEVRLRFEFRNLETDSVFYATDNVPIGIADTGSLNETSRFVAVTRLLFKPGRYAAEIVASGGLAKVVTDSAKMRINVRAFPESQLNVSDVELCSAISGAASKGDPYYKNTLHVVPSPRAVYGMGMPDVAYYAEIYGLGRLNDTTEYSLTWNVVDTYGRVVKAHSLVKSGSSVSVVEIGSENISDLPSGKYAMEILVADSIRKQTASASRYFFVYNPYVKQPEVAEGTNIDVLSSPFFAMGEKALDDIFHAANYLETPQQTNLYKKLTTVDAKRRFLAQFWAEKEKTAGPRGFNSWYEFDKRYKYANGKYKTAFRAGWLSDRGRVYIDYGPPDDIDRHASTSSGKPYQIWTYNSIEGGVIFVFVDMTGFNNYILIHSTKQGEVDDPDWQKYVQIQQ